MSFRKKITLRLIVIGLVTVIAFTGCSAINRPPTATPTPEATPVPPTPTAAPAEILWGNAQNTANNALTKVITDFASANSLQYRTLPALTPADITSGTKIVILSTGAGDVNSLASAASTTQFILLGSANSANLSNVSSIQANPADEAFMAGYLTEIISTDWRAAGLLPSDESIGSGYADAFENGARFVCGSCTPFYSPIVSFPQMASEPAGSPAGTWSADAATLSQSWLSAAFITPSAVSADVVAALNARTNNTDSVYFISTTAAPQDGSVAWVALLDTDYASTLKTLLPQVLAGQGPLNLRAQITLTSVNEDVVSPGRQDDFNRTAADLAADKIDPTSPQ